VARLSDDERVEELARMLGGEAIGDSAREHARQLLADASKSKATPGKQRPAARGKKAVAR
jgi:hypothetical protein